MNSEKVKDIKKALEQNIKSGLGYEDNDKFCNIMFADILTLINELESENERLKEQNGALSCDLDYANEKLTNAEIEVDDYKDRIAELEKENETKTDTITDLLKKQEFYEKEKLKQFAERLKEKDLAVPLHKDFMIIDNKSIDETLKEFL